MPKPKKLPLKKQKAFQRLKELLQQPGRPDLLWYHRVGEQVNRLYIPIKKSRMRSIVFCLSSCKAKVISVISINDISHGPGGG